MRAVKKKKDSLNNQTQRGASLVEYALLVALIAVVAIASVRILGRTVSQQFSTINAQIAG
jgi:Flp pilus assembly pilin Flp